MYPLPNWPCATVNIQENLGKLLELIGPVGMTEDPKIDEVLNLSEEFPIAFPLQTGRCKNVKEEVSLEKLEGYVKSAYPLLHQNVLVLYLDFILHKRKYGSSIEKKVYENMTVTDLVDRFLKKRPATFMGKNDDYLLLDGIKGRGNWESIGAEKENDITLENYLSYDEIKLSAFLSVSSFTYFVNDGKRSNKGVKPKNRNDIEEDGVIIGLIGARLKKKNVMEYQEIVYSKDQNSEKNGFGMIFEPSIKTIMSKFYGKECLSYSDFLKSEQFHNPGYVKEISKGVYFDNITYSKRMALSIDTLLFEANHRAKELKKFAYVHVVGIGLGVWKISTHQEEVFMETFAKRLELLSPHLSSISDVHFAYFSMSNSCGQYKHGSKVSCGSHPNGGIIVHVSKREPHSKLSGIHQDKLLVVSYAWDGNALPGNEFWLGKLASTGDSAAASSTQITELHNPHINRNVCGQNLHIACPAGVFHISKYLEDFAANTRKKRGNGDSEGSSKGDLKRSSKTAKIK